MPRALVLGVNGQDGSYAAEALLRRGYTVVGAGRQETSRYVEQSPAFSYRQTNLENHEALGALLSATQPDAVFHLAAIHGAAGFCYEPVFASMMAVNVGAVQAVLEYARTAQPTMRVIYANSAKIFPTPLSGAVDEHAIVRPSCLYSVSKIAALELIRYYRRVHGVAAANLILFNHESPRRSPEYFLPTVARGLVRALREPQHRFTVKTLDFRMDWSDAQELMDLAVDISERASDDDFILASGVTRQAREVVQDWFARHGLDYSRHVQELLPPQELGPAFEVRLDRLEARIGRRPLRSIDAIVDELTCAMQRN